MRIIRWIAYCVAGLLAYRVVEQVLSRDRANAKQSSKRAVGQGPNSDEQRFGILTGPGVGRDEYVEDPATGASLRERVGRGVVPQ